MGLQIGPVGKSDLGHPSQELPAALICKVVAVSVQVPSDGRRLTGVSQGSLHGGVPGFENIVIFEGRVFLELRILQSEEREGTSGRERGMDLSPTHVFAELPEDDVYVHSLCVRCV